LPLHDLICRRWAAGHAIVCTRCGQVFSIKPNYDDAIAAMAGYIGSCPSVPVSAKRRGG
jgi:hypothetical protein